MTKRPLCMAALILVLLSFAGRLAGIRPAYENTRQVLWKELFPEGEDTDQRRRFLGRIRERSETGSGYTLTVDNLIILKRTDGDPAAGFFVSYSGTENSRTEDPGAADSASALSGEGEINVSGKDDHSGREETDESNSSRVCRIPAKYAAAAYVEDPPQAVPGDWVELSGIPALFETATNPGQADTRERKLAGNVLFAIKKAVLLKKADGLFRDTALPRIRSLLRSSFETVLGLEDASVLCAMTLGERDALPSGIRRQYEEGGIAHILAISGLHTGLIGMLLYRMLRSLRLPIPLCAFVSLSMLMLYCEMTGMSIPAVRALIMFAVWAVGQCFGRSVDPLTSLGAAAVCLLLIAPERAGQADFLFSFACILSIQIIVPKMKELFHVRVGRRSERRIRKVILRRICDAVIPGAALFLGILPLSCWFYYQITPYSILANLVVLPCMSSLFLCGLFGALAGLASIPAGVFVAAPCHYILLLFQWTCGFLHRLPGSVIVTGRPALWQVILYYGILISALYIPSKRRKPGSGRRRLPDAKKTARLIRVLCLAGAVIVLLQRKPPGLRLVILDVGQGNGVLIQTGDFAVILDCGSSTVPSVWERRAEKTIKYYGIRRIDAVFLSHGDQDHINGIRSWLDGYEKTMTGPSASGLTLACLAVSGPGSSRDEALKELEEICCEKGIPAVKLFPGSSLSADVSGASGVSGFPGTSGVSGAEADPVAVAGSNALADSAAESGSGAKAGSGSNAGKELRITCLYPGDDQLQETSNENSMVLRLSYGDFTALFPGDLELEGEQELIRSLEKQQEERPGRRGGRDDLVCDLLMAGHHGSANATSEELLRLLEPEIAVISCGKNNRYGHPAEAVLERLENAHVRVHRTDREGAWIMEMKKPE